jgi:hypothetical protein
MERLDGRPALGLQPARFVLDGWGFAAGKTKAVASEAEAEAKVKKIGK